MVQLCMGIPWGAPDDVATLTALITNVPSDWVFSAFSIGRNQMPYAAMAVLAGGNIRVGLEDNHLAGQRRAGQQRSTGRAGGQGRRRHGHEDHERRRVRKKLKLRKRW